MLRVIILMATVRKMTCKNIRQVQNIKFVKSNHVQSSRFIVIVVLLLCIATYRDKNLLVTKRTSVEYNVIKLCTNRIILVLNEIILKKKTFFSLSNEPRNL